jgi:hypothetical protein
MSTPEPAALRVYKYQLEFSGGSYTRVELPRGAKFLKLALQKRRETLWAVVDPDEAIVEYEIMYAGTGWRLPKDIKDAWMFLDTIFSPDGTVWHFWWRPVRE